MLMVVYFNHALLQEQAGVHVHEMKLRSSCGAGGLFVVKELPVIFHLRLSECSTAPSVGGMDTKSMLFL